MGRTLASPEALGSPIWLDRGRLGCTLSPQEAFRRSIWLDRDRIWCSLASQGALGWPPWSTWSSLGSTWASCGSLGFFLVASGFPLALLGALLGSLLGPLRLLWANGGSQIRIWDAFWCPHAPVLNNFREVWALKTEVFYMVFRLLLFFIKI